MALQELYNQLKFKTGLILDFMLFNTTDFYQFLAYYGQNYFDIQVHMGYLVVYKKWQKAVTSAETSTPTFKESQSDYKFKNLQNFEWGEANKMWADDGNKGFGFLEKQE